MPGSRVLAAVAALVVAVVLAGVAAAAAGPLAPSRLPTCATSGPLPGLTDVQAENARIVAATAEARLGPQAAVIAVMTAMTESGLRILANPHDPSGAAYPNQGVGYDHDSLGLFQQRPSWGTAAARMDPTASTNLFLDALQAHSGWTAEPPWQVAQDVQRSAFDGSPTTANGGSAVYGGNYLAQHARALAIVADIDATSADHECGADTSTEAAPAQPGSLGLPASFRIPADAPTAARLAVTFALAQLGKPYLWGGTGPDRFDCSGLTQAAWRAAGYQLGRTTWDQATDGTPATIQTIRPGDLVLIPGSDGSLASPSHIGLYLGDGLVIHAPKSGDVVRVTDLAGFVNDGLSGIRHIA
jgi:cell wall-associated NlpC family hydrolase